MQHSIKINLRFIKTYKDILTDYPIIIISWFTHDQYPFNTEVGTQ